MLQEPQRDLGRRVAAEIAQCPGGDATPQPATRLAFRQRSAAKARSAGSLGVWEGHGSGEKVVISSDG